MSSHVGLLFGHENPDVFHRRLVLKLCDGKQSASQFAFVWDCLYGSGALGVLPGAMDQRILQLMEGLGEVIRRSADASTSLSEQLNALGRTSSGNGGAQEWSRVLAKPDVFRPATTEDEITEFPEWKWQFRQYCKGICAELGALMDNIEADVDTPFLLEDKTEAIKKLSFQLYALLGSLVRGKALQLVKGVSGDDGGEGHLRLLA